MYKLDKSSFILTRPANVITYGAFTQISDVSNSIMTVPVPINRFLYIHRVSLAFDWNVTTNPLNCRLRLIDADPSPALVLADATDGGSYPLAPYYSNVSVTPDISVFPLNGISFGSININSANLAIRSTSGSINVFLFQTNGTDAPASGKVKVNIYHRITS